MLMSISTEDLFAMARILVKNSKTPLDCIACQPKLGAQWVKKLLEMVLCFQSCSDLLWQKKCSRDRENFWNSRLQAENLPNSEITRTIYSNSERSDQFFK